MATQNKTTRERTSLVVPHSQNYAARIRGHYHGSSDCFEYPKKSLLKSSHPKKYLPNFPTQNNPGMENFKPKKILRSSLSLGIRRTPLGLVQSCAIENIRGSLKRKENPHWSRGWGGDPDFKCWG